MYSIAPSNDTVVAPVDTSLHDFYVRIDPFILTLVAVLAGILLLIVVLWAAVARLRRRSAPRAVDEEAALTVDVLSLDASGPSPEGPQLECYNVPMRLALLVLAPAGRDAHLPDDEELPHVMERLAPGFKEVVTAHQPMVRRWPPQLSASGFEQKFFRRVALPGDRGKGTPWCSVAGRFETDDEPLLAGMLLCAERPNSLSEIRIKQFGQWLNVLRVRPASA